MKPLDNRPLWVRVGLTVMVITTASLVVVGTLLVRVGEQDTGAVLVIASTLGIVSLASLLVIIRLLSRGLDSMAKGAQRFAAGDLSHRLEGGRSRELVALADALNDMSEQLHRQVAQLRVQRTEQEAILRSMEAGIIAVDGEHRILRMNRFARRMLRRQEPDLRGMPITEALSDQRLVAFAADAIADPTPRDTEIALRPGGTTGPTVRVASGPLLDLEDEPVGAILLMSDVTQLRQLESVRSDFAANVSHELRTPITNIKGYVETLIEDELSDTERSMSFLKVVARNADRLGAIVDDMLALTNLERAHGKELPTAPATPSTLIHSVIAQTSEEASAKLMVVGVADLVDDPIMVNMRLAEQALANLVLNAVKYAPIGTHIHLSATRDTLPGGQPGVRIEVRDEGPGIEPEHLSRLFERFYRVDKARSRQEGGTGLGLSIVKHIARVHQGDVGVASDLGIGSRFWLVFPCVGEELPSATR